MASHRARAQFDRAKWRLDLLLPLWALQLVLAMAMTALFSWRLGNSVKHRRARRAAGETLTLDLAWEATNIAMSFVATVCTLVEMDKLMAESLTPWAMLLTHLVKLVCALSILGLDIAVYVLRPDGRYSLAGLRLDSAMLVTAVALDVYASVTYRRLAAYGNYARPVNFKGYGFPDDDLSCSSRLATPSASSKRPSLASTRPGSARAAATEPFPVPFEGAEPIALTGGSYSHRRDMQFDDYVARRNSQAFGPAKAAGNGSVPTRSRGSSYTGEQALIVVPEEGTGCVVTPGAAWSAGSAWPAETQAQDRLGRR